MIAAAVSARAPVIVRASAPRARPRTRVIAASLPPSSAAASSAPSAPSSPWDALSTSAARGDELARFLDAWARADEARLRSWIAPGIEAKGAATHAGLLDDAPEVAERRTWRQHD